MENQRYIKWIMELKNQEGYTYFSDIENEFKAQFK